jgi:hypothetical protein
MGWSARVVASPHSRALYKVLLKLKLLDSCMSCMEGRKWPSYSRPVHATLIRRRGVVLLELPSRAMILTVGIQKRAAFCFGVHVPWLAETALQTTLRLDRLTS